MHGTSESLCVALDGSQRDWLVSTARSLSGVAGWMKLGLEAFTAHGPVLVREVAASGAKVFLDLKLHDIPATVRRAATNCAASGADMFTVHASGGRAMLEAALAGSRETDREKAPAVVAVTLLTSLDGAALAELGLDKAPAEIVARWASMARDCGLDGVVASALEAAQIRSACGPDFLIVTPGVRPSWSPSDDQRRVVTPREALVAGADIVVIGRPIIGAPSPVDAAARVLAEMVPGS